MNNQSSLQADTNTVYRIGSISKAVTAYLMMLMVQTGKINLDDPVIKYLPELSNINKDGKKEGDYITFRQLADHTSGLAREPEDLINNATGIIEEWENKVLNSIPNTKLSVPIGASYAYSNIGYAILGLALSRAAKKPFIDLVDEMVFRPHRMFNSFYIVTPANKNKIAAGYHWDQSTGIYSAAASEKELAGRGYKVPNGGVFTTAKNLARFAIASTADGDVLEEKYRDSMQTTQLSLTKRKVKGMD
jgi:CubicO group peptidase (beta-lactamase class C family)